MSQVLSTRELDAIYCAARSSKAPQFTSHLEGLENIQKAILAKLEDRLKDAERWQKWRLGNGLTVVVPTPTDDKPNRKVTIIYSPSPEPAYSAAIDAAIDAQKGQPCN